MYLNKVELCGVNTNELPLLSEEEKDILFERISHGDLQAREQYIRGNLRLVLSIIGRFSNTKENPDDLFQVGCIGLMKAIDNFDRTLDVKFSTYAVPMIMGEVRRYLRDNNSIRVSRSLRDIAYKAICAKEQLTRTNDRTPSVSEISQAVSLPEKDVIYALDAIAAPVSLFEPVYEDDGDVFSFMDQIYDKKNKEDRWIEKLSIENAMEHLSNRELYIIKKRYYEGKTQTEVANEISISQAQVSRLEKNALKIIRTEIDA